MVTTQTLRGLLAALALSVCTGGTSGCLAADDTGESADSLATAVTAPPKLSSLTCAATVRSSGDKGRCYLCQTLCKGEARPSFCDDTGFADKVPVDSCLKSKDIVYANAPGVQVPAFRFFSIMPVPEDRSEEEFLRPTPLLPYMRHLRNLGNSDPAWRATLDNQLAYAWSIMRSYPATATEPASRVWQTYFQRSDGAIREYAQGMSEAIWAEYLTTIASGEVDATRRSDFLGKALLVDSALERNYVSRNGGARRDAGTCGPAGFSGPCWYFHTRAPQNSFVAGTALNQSLHIIIDAMAELDRLTEWKLAWPTGFGITREAWMARLQKRIDHGLMQWAYGVSGAANQAPNLIESRWKLANSAQKPFFWSWYEYNVEQGAGANNVTDQHVCHYHTLTLQNLARIVRDLDPAHTGDLSNVATKLGPSHDRIQQARNQMISFTRNGVPDAIGADNGQALYQWFRAEIDPAYRSQSSLACNRFPTEHAFNNADNDNLKTYLCGIFAAANIPQCAMP